MQSLAFIFSPKELMGCTYKVSFPVGRGRGKEGVKQSSAMECVSVVNTICTTVLS